MSGPDVWGPHGWKFIHYVTIGYPSNPTNDIKKQYLEFFTALQYVIPCSICGNNFKQHLKEYPLTDAILSNKKKFIDWGIQMHNLVNISNNKKTFNSSNGLKEIIKNCTGDCPGYTNIEINQDADNIEIFSSDNSIISMTNIILIIIIIILIFFIVKK